jgi:L-ascorbate metabolism protein UlaG (beta-lactamase superfamily)
MALSTLAAAAGAWAQTAEELDRCYRIADAAAEFDPAVIGISSTTVAFHRSRTVAQRLRSRTKAPIVLGGVHGSALPDGSYGGNPCGFLFYLDGKKIYHACDTGLFGDMQLIGEEGIDLAILPIGDNFTMGPDDALRAVKLIQPKRVVPIHYNTFDVIRQDPNAWAARVQKETAAKVTVMQPGETIEI